MVVNCQFGSRQENYGSSSASSNSSAGASQWNSDIDNNPQKVPKRPQSSKTYSKILFMDRKSKPDTQKSRPDVEPVGDESTQNFNANRIGVDQTETGPLVTGIGQKLLDAGRVATSVVMNNGLASSEDAEEIAEASEKAERQKLRAMIYDYEQIMQACQREIHKLTEELTLVKRIPYSSPSATEPSLGRRPIDVITRRIHDLKLDIKNAKKDRENTIKELERISDIKYRIESREMKEKHSVMDDLDSEAAIGIKPSIGQPNSYIQNRRSYTWPSVSKCIKNENDDPSEKHSRHSSSTGSFRRFEQSYQQQSEHFNKSLENVRSNSVERGLTGLINLGCSCYMNSIVQCLSNTVMLRDYFLTDEYRRDINYTNVLGSKGELAQSFADLLKILWAGTHQNFEPKEFKRTIGTVAETFNNQQQQDASEFMVFLLDGLHEDLNKVNVRAKIEEQNNNGIQLSVAANRSWLDHLKLNDSVIVKLFQGQFLSVTKCTICSTKSNVFDILMYLSLPLPAKEETSECDLDMCFQKFLIPELMSNDGMWFCPTCKQKREAQKQLLIWRVPMILIIHFKRFTQRGVFHEKLNTMVNFPLQLNVDDYVYGDKTNKLYNLYGVVNHYGRANSGHNTAYCKNGSKWYCYDDDVVTEIDEGVVQSRAAYILFYTASENSTKRPYRCAI